MSHSRLSNITGAALGLILAVNSSAHAQLAGYYSTLSNSAYNGLVNYNGTDLTQSYEDNNVFFYQSNPVNHWNAIQLMAHGNEANVSSSFYNNMFSLDGLSGIYTWSSSASQQIFAPPIPPPHDASQYPTDAFAVTHSRMINYVNYNNQANFTMLYTSSANQTGLGSSGGKIVFNNDPTVYTFNNGSGLMTHTFQSNAGIDSAQFTIDMDARSYGTNYLSSSGIVSFGMVWSYTGTYPGATASNPLLPATSISNPNQTTVNRFIVPCSGFYGTLGFVYVDPAYALGYSFASSSTNFKAVLVPNATPSGDVNFTVNFGAFSFPIVAGQSFDFTQYVPDGVSQFTITGIDDMLDPNDPTAFVTGLEFMDDGLADFTMQAITAVPEPSTVLLLCSPLVAILAHRGWRRFKRKEQNW